VNRFSKQQLIIFTSVFLAISVLANTLFTLNLTSQNKELSDLQSLLQEKTALVSDHQYKDNQRLHQFETISSLQMEVATKVSEIRNEIKRLQTYQTSIDQTVDMIKQRLARTRVALVKNSEDLHNTKTSLSKNLEELQDSKKKLKNNSAELETTMVKLKERSTELEATKQELKSYYAELETTKFKLKEAQGTIHNQQRALKKISQQNEQLSLGAQAILQKLSQRFSGKDPVRIVQTSNSIQLNIPINVLFNSKRPMLDITALRWLSPIAEALAEHPEVDIHVIGHTDARPIA
jgi:chromosome segregation ATPase